MRATTGFAAVLTAAALTLTACGGDDGATTSDVPSSADFNDADVSFATGMIPHHAQALVMVDMTRSRDLDPDFEALTEQILAAQAPEIELMAGWLEDWDRPVPETSRDHLNAEGGHDMGGMDMDDEDMPGMMGDDDLSDLEDSTRMDFEDMWLRMMIEHHEGAIEMAQDEVGDGEFPAAIDLAESIETSQQAEIVQMEAMLED